MPSRFRPKPSVIASPRRPDGLPFGGGTVDLTSINSQLAALQAFALGRWEVYTNGDPVATEFLFYGGDPVYYFNPTV